MIKKIYDRDTGNVYDVGADNKLKLVAEGNISEYGDDYITFTLQNRLEPNKLYLVKKFDNMSGLITDNIISTYGSNEVGIDSTSASSLLVDDDTAYNIPASMSYYESENNTIYCINYTIVGGYHQIGTLSFDEATDTVEVYELPFSM